MSKLQQSKMFRRLDSFAKKVSSSTKLSKKGGGSAGSKASASSSSSHSSDEDGHAHVDHEDLDMNLLIGPNKGRTAAQIIDELDSRFFDQEFDPLEEILSSLPASQSQQSDELLEAKLNELDVVKLCIDKRLSNQVFANYHHFVDGLSLIGNIKDDLFETSLLCQDGRIRLSAVSRELTISIFSTLQQSQRTARLTTVQMHLADISTLLRKEKEIALLLKEGEFTQAVNVYKESLGRLAQSGMNKFTCLDDLRKRYLRSAESINARAKEQLQTMCRKFDLQQCRNVVESIISLGETKVLTELLRKHLPLVVDELSVSSLLPYLDHDRIAPQDDGNDIRSKRFKELAQLLDMTRFAACYLTLTSAFTDVMSSSSRMEDYFSSILQDGKESVTVLSSITSARDFLSVYRQDVWQQVQGHVTTLLTSVYLTTQTIHIDDFLRVLHAGFAFIVIGEGFSRGNGDLLRGQLYKKAKEFVRLFARESFDGVRAGLQKEEWKPLKTSRGFVMSDLLELKPRKQPAAKKEGEDEEKKEEAGDAVAAADGSSDGSEQHRAPPLDSIEPADAVAGGIYEAFLRGENAFRVTLQEQLLEYDRRLQERQLEKERGRYYRLQSGVEYRPTSKLLASKSMQSSLQHASLLTSHTNADLGIILTASSLTTARYLGRYIAVMEDLKPLAVESFGYLQEVVELYLYAIFCMFGPKQSDFFTDYFDKYLALKKLVQSVKAKVEQGTFGAGVFQSFAVPRPAAVVEPAQSPVASSSASSTPMSLTAPGSAGKDKSLFGKLGKTLNSQVMAGMGTMGSMAGIGGGGGAGGGASAAPKPAAVFQHREEKRGHPVLVQLNSSVDVEDERRMYAVTERCIAIESCPFLLDVVSANQHRMLSHLKPSEAASLRSWLQSTAAAISELQSYMYRNLAPVMLPDSCFAPKIRNMDWSIKAAADRASPYVFSILTTLRANTLCMKDNGGLPADTQHRLNTEIVDWLEDSLVAAYGEVKRCSEHGRGLMRLDSQVLEAALKQLLRLDELRGWQRVTDYVDAYWLKAEDWLQWVREHRDYSLSVVVSCIQAGCGSAMEKKEQKELLLSVSREWQRLSEEEEQRRDEERSKDREERKEADRPSPTHA